MQTSKRRNPLAGLAFIGLAALNSQSLRADIDCDPIVYDPTNHGKNSEQVVQLIQQVQQAKLQIENQLKTLQKLSSTNSPAIGASVTALRGMLNTAAYSGGDVASTMQQQYPVSYANIGNQQATALRQQWVNQYRQTLVENRQVQNQVVRAMPETTQQVQAIVSDSNGAVGEVGAIQAHNRLLAVYSVELAKLQALRVSRARAKMEKLAAEQSDRAYREQQRLLVRGDWEHPVKTTSPAAYAFE